MSMTKPPYDPNKLHPPLSKTVRNKIIAWIAVNALDPFAKGGGLDKLPTGWKKFSDADLLKLYGLYCAAFRFEHAPVTGPGNPLDAWASVQDAIKAIIGAVTSAAFWLRVGEVLLGLVLIGVGATNLSKRAGASLSSVPVYGKVLGAVA